MDAKGEIVRVSKNPKILDFTCVIIVRSKKVVRKKNPKILELKHEAKFSN